MSRITIVATALIVAQTAAIYGTLADYHTNHAHILPTEFQDLEVEAGGHGAGTIFRLRSRIAGVERSYRMVVSEPEPGHVLVERDTLSTLVTTFTVTPMQDGQQTRVQIMTELDSSPGLPGLLERTLLPSIMRRIYKKELHKIAQALC